MRGRRQLIALVALAFGCSHPSALAELASQADLVGVLNQPVVDTLVARVHAVKHELRGNVPGWETQWRIAELANDQLGLPPFAQMVPPGPGWHPVPASVLGMRGYVHTRAGQLVAAGDRDGLAFLVRDERARYARGLAEVDEHLTEIEHWLGVTSSSSSRRSDSSRPDTSGGFRTSP